ATSTTTCTTRPTWSPSASRPPSRSSPDRWPTAQARRMAGPGARRASGSVRHPASRPRARPTSRRGSKAGPRRRSRSEKAAGASLAPAGEVSDAAEEVARTHDLTHRIEVRGDDELGRLAASFNQMMSALERSEAAQRRLVADASHELRTPLATLRTNIETLG